MSDFEQNIPDDFWRKAFEKAAEPPPPHVWDAIERRLDDDKGTKILPLWGTGLATSRPVVWSVGIAAAVALLLVGWWTLRTTSPENLVARQQSSSQSERVATSATPDKLTNPALKQTPKRPSTAGQQETVAFREKPTFRPRNGQLPAPAQLANGHSTGQQTDRKIVDSPAQPASVRVAATPGTIDEPQVADVQLAQPARQSVTTSASQASVAQNERVSFMNNSPAPTTSANTLLLAPESSPISASLPVSERPLSFEPVLTSALRLREPGAIQRIVWFRPAEPATQTAADQSIRETRAMWASVSMMPGAFSPSVAVRTTQASFAKANTLSNTAASQSSVSSRANFSVAYQAGAGVQLTEHWSVESGVGYLAGRSTVESPAQVTVLSLQSASPSTSAQRTNLYVDALRGSSVSASPLANSTTNFNNMAAYDRSSVQNNYNPQDRQLLTNDYHFVQVPVQVGYQLRPRKRLGLALLGGFLSNIFVRNTVGDNLVITAKDGIYRPVSWAATMGARFRYRPSRQWSASLAGIYQPSLGSGTRPESAVQTRPTSTGVSFGIDYHF